MKKKSLWIVVLLCTVLFVGCGGSDVGNSENGSGNSGGEGSANPEIINNENDRSLNEISIKRITHNFDGAKAVVSHESGISTAKSADGEAIIDVLLDKITEAGIEPAVSIIQDTILEEVEEGTSGEGETEEEVAEENGDDTESEEINQPSDEITFSDDNYNQAPAVEFTIKDPNTETWYVSYGNKFLYNGKDSCKFFKIIDEIKVECVDPEISTIQKKNIKFGADGTIYYYAYIISKTKSADILRRKLPDGTIQELTHEYVTVIEFFPLSNNEVYILGRSNDKSFIRKINNVGGLESVVERASITDVYLAADESLFVSAWDVNDIRGIAHIVLSEGSYVITPLLNKTDIGGSDVGYDGTYCQWLGSNDNINIYCVERASILKVNSQSGTVTIVRTIGHADELRYYRLLGDKFYYYAITNTDFILESFGLTDSLVDNLLEGIDDTIEFYNVVVFNDGYIYFTGLRFSDNKIVVGQINPDKSVTYLDTVTKKPEILETAE